VMRPHQNYSCQRPINIRIARQETVSVMSRITVLGVPSSAGARGTGQEHAPQLLRQAGDERTLNSGRYARYLDSVIWRIEDVFRSGV